MSPIRVEDISQAQKDKKNDQAAVEAHYGKTITHHLEEIFNVLIKATTRTIREAQQAGVPAANFPTLNVAFTTEEKQELLALTETIRLMTGADHAAVQAIMDLIAAEILGSPTKASSESGEAARRRLFDIFIEHARTKLGITNFLTGVNPYGYPTETPDNQRRVIEDITFAFIRQFRTRLEDKEGGFGKLSVPTTPTWYREGDFWVPAVPETAISAKPNFEAFAIDNAPPELVEPFTLAEFRLLGLNVVHNLASKIHQLGNTKIPAKKVVEIYQVPELRTAQNPFIFEQLFSKDESSERHELRYNRASMRAVDWVFADFTRLGMAMQDRAMKGIPEEGAIIPPELPFFASQPGRMLDAIQRLNEVKYKRSAGIPLGNPLDTRTQAYLSLGSQESFIFNRATLAEMSFDIKAIEQEMSQLFNARWYYDIYTGAKTVESPITGKKLGPDTGRVRPRYGMNLQEYMQMYALVPEEAIEVIDDFNWYFNTYLPGRYPDQDKRRRSKEYVQAVGAFTRDEWRDAAGNINYADFANKYVGIQIRQDYRIFQDTETPDIILIPRQRLERVDVPVTGGTDKVYYRIQASVYDLLVRSRLAEIDPHTGNPMLLLQTVPIEPIVNYDALLDYEHRFWHSLATVEASAENQVWKDINKINVQVVYHPAKFSAQFNRFLQKTGIGIRRGVAVLNFIRESEREWGGLNKDNESYRGFVNRLQADLQTEMYVPDDAVTIHDLDEIGFFTFFDQAMKYYLDKLEAGNPGDVPSPHFDAVGNLQYIDFDKFTSAEVVPGPGGKLGKKDISVLRELFRDATDDKESLAFFSPYRMDYWIQEYESEAIPPAVPAAERVTYLKKQRFDARLGMYIELLIAAYMLYLNRYMLSEVTEDRSLANYKEIRIDTTSGFEPLTPNIRARLVEVVWQYMLQMTRQLLNEEFPRHGHQYSREEAARYLSGLREPGRPINPQNQNTWWYSRDEMMTTLRYLMRRAGVEGSFESGVVDLQWIDAGGIEKMPTISQYNRAKEEEQQKKAEHK